MIDVPFYQALWPRQMRRVILESPFAGDVATNVAYAQACVRDALLRGEAPLASHLLYTQPNILNADDVRERAHGINAGHAWLHLADAVVVYTDRGVSEGMKAGISMAEFNGIPVEYRNGIVFNVLGASRTATRYRR
jgi:hypothetical protein